MKTKQKRLSMMGLAAVLLGPGTATADDRLFLDRGEPTAPELHAVAESPPVDFWTSGGPYMGSPGSLAVDPSDGGTAYSAVTNDLYKTMDGGSSWFPVLRTIGSVTDVVVPASRPSMVYAAGFVGIVKSQDAGRSWDLANDGLPLENFSGLLVPFSWRVFVSPIDPDRLFAIVGASERLYRSSDGGQRWKPAHRGLNGPVTDLTFDPGDPSRIYASTWKQVYLSTNGGASWSSIGGPDALQNIETILVTSETGKPSSIFVGSRRGNFRSSDGGTTWTVLGDPDMHLGYLEADPSSPSPIYAGTAFGVFKSLDSGESWSWSEGPGARLVLALTVGAGQVYVSTGASVLRTTDGGASWQTAGGGLPTSTTWDLEAHPRKKNVLFSLSREGLFQSEDRGGSWHALGAGWPSAGDDPSYPSDLAIDPENPRRMYAAVEPIGAFPPVDFVSGGVYRSDDGGATWSNSSDGLPVYVANVHFDAQSCEKIAVEPRDPRTVYCLADEGSPGKTVYKSLDGADHWQPNGEGLPPSIDYFQPHPTVDRLYALSGRDGLFVSEDRAETWRPVNEISPQLGLLFFALDPHHPDVVYAAPSNDRHRSLIKSEDGGVTWKPVHNGLPPGGVGAMTFTSSTAYVGTREGVFQSANGGQTWQAFRNGLPLWTRVLQLVAHPQEPHRIYAGTFGRGVFQVNRLPEMSFHDGRFKVEVEWKAGDQAGVGKPIVLGSEGEGTISLRSDATSVVWLFDRNNWEMVLKVLDGRSQNEHHWVLLAAATHVAYTVTVEDTSCTSTRIYENNLGTFAPAILDNRAFAECSSPVPPDCREDETTICLGTDRRFRVRITWRDDGGTTGFGHQVEVPAGVSQSESSGLFYFFGPDNWELLIKVLDGCRVNGSYWVLSAAATNVGYTIRVTDTLDDVTREYIHPEGSAAPAIIDTRAFPSCVSP